jgi:hypothetical protein
MHCGGTRSSVELERQTIDTRFTRYSKGLPWSKAPCCEPPDIEAPLLDDEATVLRCPECAGEDFDIRSYDFGTDNQTGYHDAGERYECSCGATGDAADLERVTIVLNHELAPEWPEIPVLKPIGVKVHKFTAPEFTKLPEVA